MSKPHRELLLYRYNSLDWWGVEAGNYRDASCRPDPDFKARTWGLCRPPLRKTLREAWRGELSKTGLDILFLTPVRGGGIALVAWLPVKEIYANHAAAGAHWQLPVPSNLMVKGSRCVLGTRFDGKSLGGRAIPKECSCECYECRVDGAYVKLGEGAKGAIREHDPVLVKYEDLRSDMSTYARTKWPGAKEEGPNEKLFMQSGQGWGHRIKSVDDIERLRARFFGGPTVKMRPEQPSTANQAVAKKKSHSKECC